MRGGKRKGAGRKPGSLSRRHREIAARAAQEGLTPLEVLLDVMRNAHRNGMLVLAVEAAKSAAPYIHPRLNAVEVSGDKDAPLKMVIEWASQSEGS